MSIGNFQDAVKDKYSPQYECTVLSDLSVDNIYIPNSEGVSPIQSDVEIGNNNTSVAGNYKNVFNLPLGLILPLLLQACLGSPWPLVGPAA